MAQVKYNGWTNYETWCVALWLGNDEGSYNYWREQARDVWDEAADPAERNRYFKQTQEEFAKYKLAERLKDELREAGEDVLERSNACASLWSGLLGAALGSVDYDEIASDWIDELAERST